MQNKTYFKIADLIFALDSADLKMLPVRDLAYRQFFINSTDNPTKIDFTFHIKAQDFDIDNNFREIPTFAGNTWLLYQKDCEYFIMPKKFDEQDSLPWVLRFDHKFNDVCIYYNENNVCIKNSVKTIENMFCRGALDILCLMYYLFKNQGGLIHAAGAVINNQGYIFPAVSQTGKSTLAKLCIKYGFGSWLGDERIVVKKGQNGFNIYGTPWQSAAKVAQNKGAPLAGIFFIAHGNRPIIKPLVSKEVIVRFLPVTTIPWYDQEFTQLAFNFLENLVNKIPAFEFSYKLEKNAVHVLQEFIANHA